MADERIILSALWVARMLTGLQGDVLRFLQPGLMEQIGSGDIGGMALTDSLLLAASMVMLLPIAMVVLSLTLPCRASRWANILLATFFIAFDLVGLPSYGSAHGIALIAAGIAFNVATVWTAWTWRSAARSQRSV